MSMTVTENSLMQPIIADEPHAADSQTTQLDTDALLQASRRVDWRFLLPDPNLRQVAYLGPAHGALLESLRLFSASLALSEAASAQYDVVVAHNPPLDTLRRAAGLIRPGGFLYVEAYGPLHRRRLRRGPGRWPRFAADY